MRLVRRLALVAVIVVAIGAGLVLAVPAVTAPPEVPTTHPERGDVEMRVHARGEIAPHQSVSLSAPPIGGQLQLVTLLPGGALVKKDEVVMAFDPEAQRHNLAQAQSEFQEAEQEIRKLGADARVKEAEDELALVEAQFAVKLAAVRVSGNEFVGTIEARKNELALEEAQRKVEQLERDIRTRAAGNEAALTALTEKRRKAELAIALAERNIERMTVRAPIDGMVTVNLNRGMMGFPGMVIPEFREGDTVQPGTVVANIVDLSAVEVTAKVDENARTALTEGTAATVQVDAVPGGVALEAKARRLGSIAAQGFVWIASTPEFEASFRIEHPPSELRPGMTAAVVASTDVVKDVIHLPRQALFQRDGKPVVYVRRGNGFEPREVKVLRLTESRVVLEGVTADDEVALADPERAAAPGGRTAPRAPAPPGGA